MNPQEPISALPVATGIDASTSYWPLLNGGVTERINRNTALDISSDPVGVSDTQTLTNKTISGSNNTITNVDPANVVGLPSVASIVTLTGTQTLTNKTLTAPIINGGTISNTTIQVDAIAGFTDPDSGSIYGAGIVNGIVASTALVDAVNTNAIQNLATTTPKLGDGAVTAIKTSFGGDYTTSEVNTGFKWVDNKDIFKKTISMGALPNATVKNVAHGVADIETVVACTGWSRQSAGGTHLPLPYANPVSTAAVALYAGSTNVSVETGSNRTAFVDTYATIWYTKT